MNSVNAFSADFLEPNEIGRFTDWDLDFRQIAPGSGTTRVSVRGGQLLSTLWIDMPYKVHQIGAAPADVLTFGLPGPGMLSNWLRTEAPELPLVCFGAGREFDGVSQAGFHALTVSIARTEFTALARDTGIDLPADHHAPALIDLNSRPDLAEIIQRKSARFSYGALEAANPEDEEDLAIALLLAVANARARIHRSSPRMRDRVLQRALDALDARAEDTPSIRELCVLCDTSMPTLHRAFVERFGLPPKTYINAQRLNRVRQDLKSKNFEGNVSDAANRWGFWHMGQFAKDYRRLFRCLPSDDLYRQH